jgi:ribosomal protein S18 acetylase RimI-like enzyme
VLLLALDQEELVGYGLSHVLPAEETWVADTWRTGPRIAEVESLSILPAYRGRGIGTALLDRLEDEIEAQGVEDLVIGVLPGNVDAIRLYERRGFRPTWLYLSRFAGR